MKNQKGFTLIELIVVIAILGILSAIAVPKFGGFSEKAKLRADEASIKILNDATQLYGLKENKDLVDITADELKENGTTLVKNNYLESTPTPQSKDAKFVWHQLKEIWSLDDTMFSLKDSIFKNSLYSDTNIETYWATKDDGLLGKGGINEKADHRIYFPSTSKDYTVEVTAKVDKESWGYGVLIDTGLTDGDKTKNLGYSVQYDLGANNRILIRPTTGGNNALKEVYSIDMNKITGLDISKIHDKHTLKIDVKDTTNNKRAVDLYIKFENGKKIKINGDTPIELPENRLQTESLDRYVGIRTWKGNTNFYDYKVTDK